MEASKSLTEGSFGSTPGSCRSIRIIQIIEARTMFHFAFQEKEKKRKNKIAGCSKYTEARMEDTKDWSASSLLISAGLEESFALSCTDNWRAAVHVQQLSQYCWINNNHFDIVQHTNTYLVDLRLIPTSNPLKAVDYSSEQSIIHNQKEKCRTRYVQNSGSYFNAIRKVDQKTH